MLSDTSVAHSPYVTLIHCIKTIAIFQILSPYKLLHNIEYSSLCYTVGPFWLSILYIVVCIC